MKPYTESLFLREKNTCSSDHFQSGRATVAVHNPVKKTDESC